MITNKGVGVLGLGLPELGTLGAGSDRSAGSRPVVLVTGAGRLAGIATRIAVRLAEDGWDVATTHWAPYDARMPWGEQPEDVQELGARIRAAGAETVALPADLTDVHTPAALFATVADRLGPVTALVMGHAESVDSDLLSTTVESFDRHFAVNTRASWLLIKAFAEQLKQPEQLTGRARVVALTSDHTAFNCLTGRARAPSTGSCWPRHASSRTSR